jgi:single-strand DNA-binding protein
MPENNGQYQKKQTPEFEIRFIGNVGRDPEMRFTPGGTAVTNFTVAVNLPVFANGQSTIETSWWRVVCFGKQAEIANEWARKGRKIMVKADRIEFDPATGGPKIFTRNNGTPGAAFEVTAFRVIFLDSGGREVAEAEATVETEALATEEQISFT